MLRHAGGAAAGIAAALLAGCTSLPPLPEGWDREQLSYASDGCVSRGGCRVTLGRDSLGIVVESRTEEFAAHQLPGWERGRGAVAAEGVLLEVVRALGVRTDHRVVGLGTRTVAEDRPDGLRLTCATYFIEDRTLERVQGDDRRVDAERHAEGMVCDVPAPPGTGGGHWRLRYGIAPPRDSLAARYDSLRAAGSPDVARFPPAVIERIDEHGGAVIRFRAARPDDIRTAAFVASRRFTFADGSEAARMHGPAATTFDYAPGVSADERRMIRLFGAALASRIR